MPDTQALSRLDPSTFEHLVNALALRELGAGVTGFGPGPDGGRDGWFEGEAPYPSAAQRWSGIWYIQSKFHAPHLSTDPQKWLIQQIRNELRAFSDPRSKRVWPDNWIVATNINPSGAPRSGSFDRARQLIATARPSLAPRFHIWGGDKLCDFLDRYPNVAQRFGDFLTPGHVLAALVAALEGDRAVVEDIIRYLVFRGIEHQKHTHLEQAGSTEDRSPGIEALFVDLPFVDKNTGYHGLTTATLARASATNHRLDVVDPSGDAWVAWRRHPARASVWFVRAGPGRGKSSICQFFCQVQRAALILEGGRVAHSDLRSLAQRIRVKAKDIGCWPQVPRIPLWVELKSYAAWYAEQPHLAPKGIATYVCALLRKDIEISVSVQTFRRALEERSWVAVFDGLDEVPGDVKDEVAAEVVAFMRDASERSDLLALCTSRPQGYAGHFDSLEGAVVDLVNLTPALALECAAKVAPFEADGVLLERAINIPAVRELMTTPLQAHIVAVLIRNGQRVPGRKWDLYRRFYEVLRDREANRNLPDPELRDLLQQHPVLVDTVHQRLGFELHTRAETAAGAEASLEKSAFRRLVAKVASDFRSNTEAAAVVDALMRATTERLVLINTPDQGDRVRFDIRAIQEFFAAESLYVDVATTDLRSHLELLAGDSHWREVVQFLLDALISTRRATELTIALDVLGWLDDGAGEPERRALHHRLAPGAFHAILLLENGAAEGNRKVRDQLRQRLTPIAGATDPLLFGPVNRTAGSESRAWLWEWACEQLAERAPREATGAMRVLAALCSKEPEKAPAFVRALQDVPTGQLAILANGLRHEFRQAAGERATLPHWVSDIRNTALTAKDSVKSAPCLVEELFREEATSRAAVRTRRRFPATLVDSRQNPDLALLRRLFDKVAVDIIAGVEIGQAQLSSFGKRELKRRSRTGDGHGVIGWLALVWRAAVEPSIRNFRAVLERMGDEWIAAAWLPAELQPGVPTPSDPSVSPSAMNTCLAALTDEEIKSGLAAGRIGSVALSRGRQDGRRFVLAVRHDLKPLELLAVAERYPDIGWSLWCDHQAGVPGGGVAGESDARVRSTVADMLVDNPCLIFDAPDESMMFAGLKALGGESSRVRSAIAAAEMRWPLRVDGRRYFARATPIALTLSLPEERRLLTPIASSILGQVIAEIDRGRQEPAPTVAVRRHVGRVIEDSQELVQIADDDNEDPAVRASAALLAALHPHRGIDELIARKASLGPLSRLGVPVAAASAAVIEVLGESQNRSARETLSEFLAASRPLDQSVNTTLANSHALDTVLRRWRERSAAPVTSSHMYARWNA